MHCSHKLKRSNNIVKISVMRATLCHTLATPLCHAQRSIVSCVCQSAVTLAATIEIKTAC